MSNVKDKVIEIIEELSTSPVENESQSLREDLGVNSLNAVMMIVAFEEAFGIEFAESDLNPAIFTTVDSVLKVVERYVLAKEDEEE